jgi:DNA-binding PadR family transcriptional regulator
VYATLERLVGKGYVRETDVPGGSERSGLARRFYALTPSGRGALEEARDLQTRMWAGLKLKTERRKP